MRNQIIQAIGRTLRVADVVLSKRAITIALIASALMTGCMYLPRYVEGIPTTEPWSALPLRGWITNDGIRAEAITACFAADCPQKIAVASLIAQDGHSRADPRQNRFWRPMSLPGLVPFQAFSSQFRRAIAKRALLMRWP
jgi:hypothetical protein